MATVAREEQHKQPLGAGGKFRKTPFRRTTHTTPYDRPPSTTANGGWISKLVDPAQKLLKYSAHRLFSTVFHKRLPPPPPTPPSSEANHAARFMGKGEVDIDSPGVHNDAIKQNGPRAASVGDGFPLLEQILEQKTFTKPEIDRLKKLLHSRTDTIPTENLEKRSEVIPSMAMISHDRKEEYAKTPWQDESVNRRLFSTPIVSTTVPEEDAASPVELAKAYMDNRSTKLSPSLLGLRNQAVYEDPHTYSVAFPSKSPLISAVPRSSSNGAAPDIGFAAPRSRGRSAIHSMARTPYSRVQMRSTLKGVGSTVDNYRAPSSSTQSICEQSQPSGSKQGALKRRFSVLDNDIGSIGPIRRIRPKPNLLSSRGLSSPLSTWAIQNPSSSTKRQPKHTLANASSENGDNAVPRTCYSTVPSQSSKAASKIFDHLDKITSPMEKSSGPKLLSMSDGSPTKLSPSMLRGQALKSLENVDSSKFLDNPRYKNDNMDVSSNQLIPDASSPKHDNVKENCPSRILAPCDISSTVANEVESTTEKEDVVIKVKPAVSAASNTVVDPPEKKRPFKMSAHEYLELDDDDYSISGHVPGSFADGKVQVDKIAAANLEKPIASAEVKPPSSFALTDKSDSRTSDGVYTVAPGATDTVPKSVHTDKADKNNSDAEVPSSVPDTHVSSSAAAAPTSIFSTTSQVSNNIASQSSLSSMALTANTNSGNNIAATSAVTTSSSNLFNSVSAPSFSAEPFFKVPVSTATTVTQAPENSSLELLGDKSKQDGGFANISRTVLPGTSVTSAGTGNGLVGVPAAASFPAATNQSGPTFSSGSGSGPSVQASPGLSFKSEPSTASTSLTSGRSSLEFLNDKNKEGGSFGNVSSTLFSGTFATTASASSNSFGFSSVASTPTVTSQVPGSALFSGGSGTGSGTHVSPAVTGVAAFTQSAPVQPGSSSSSSVFNFVGNTAFSSGSSAVGSSTPSSGVNPSSSSTASSTAFGSGWLPATSSKFASTVNSTSPAPAFQFGASSASAATNTSSISFGASSSFTATSNSAPTVFGMSSAPAPTSNSLPTLFGASTVSAPTTNSASGFGMSNGASSTGVFSFASTAASQPAFGNSNPMGFSTAPSGNNDQMSMEDSMAEDTVHALQPTVAAFGQQSVSAPQSTPAFQFSQQPVSTPQTSFVFGGSTNGFPFQSQPNQSNSQNPLPFQPVNGLANSQNPPPFQGSSSLGLTTNSFSLGAADKSNRKFVKVNRSKNRKK